MKNINYVQIRELTDAEKVIVYSKLTKKQLVEMLIENNRMVNILNDALIQQNMYYREIKNHPVCQRCGSGSIIVQNNTYTCKECYYQWIKSYE